MLEINNLSWLRGRHHILHNVELRLEQGQVMGVLGPNGAGKSALLNVIAGLTKSHTGHLTWQGKALARLRLRQRARTIGLLEQQCESDGAFTVKALAELGAWPHGWNQRECQRKVEAALIATEMLPLANSYMDALSGGEHQRAHLARLIVQSPTLWLLDEPTNHLDIAHAHAIMALMRGKTALIALHDINLAARYCDRLLLLANGKVVAFGTPEEVLRSERLSAVYGIDAHRLRSTAHSHPVIEFGAV